MSPTSEQPDPRGDGTAPPAEDALSSDLGAAVELLLAEAAPTPDDGPPAAPQAPQEVAPEPQRLTAEPTSVTAAPSLEQPAPETAAPDETADVAPCDAPPPPTTWPVIAGFGRDARLRAESTAVRGADADEVI